MQSHIPSKVVMALEFTFFRGLTPAERVMFAILVDALSDND
jgi:hypothetical protein